MVISHVVVIIAIINSVHFLLGDDDIRGSFAKMSQLDCFMKMSQSMEDGAMGLISCMFLPEAQSGEFYGPGKGSMAMKGKAIMFPLEAFYDNEGTRNLIWEKSCEAIGESFDI